MTFATQMTSTKTQSIVFMESIRIDVQCKFGISTSSGSFEISKLYKEIMDFCKDLIVIPI